MTMMMMEDAVYDMDQYTSLTEKELYDQIKTREARKVLLTKFTANPVLWSNKFAETIRFAQQKKGGLTSTFRGLRILIQRQTLYSIENGYYYHPNNEKFIFDAKEIVNSAKETKYYSSKDINDINILNWQNEEKQSMERTEVDVINTDCLDAAYSLLDNGYNPCLLNMANEHSPGGGFQSGCGAQEENLCRRSTLITALINHVKTPKDKLDSNRKWKYPIAPFGCIYVPNVVIFRSNEAIGYKYLAKPYKISIITAAMHQRPKFDKDFDYDKKIKPEIVKKLKSVLLCALDNGHDSIVLSAWGCGAFCNPPLGQSKLWKEIICGDEFRGRFKKIIFAIFDDHNSGKGHNPFGNYLPFIDTFDIVQKRIEEFVEQKETNQEAYKVVSGIFECISDNEKSRDLDYNELNNKLENISSAMGILYCGGFRRSSDGSRLQLERQRMDIAKKVFERLRAAYT